MLDDVGEIELEESSVLINVKLFCDQVLTLTDGDSLIFSASLLTHTAQVIFPPTLYCSGQYVVST